MPKNDHQKSPDELNQQFKKSGLKALEHLNAILQMWDSVMLSPGSLDAIQHAERYLALALGRLKGISEETLKPTEVAKLLGISYKRVIAMLHAIPSHFPHAYREGTDWHIPKSDVELAQNRKPGRPIGWRKNKPAQL